MGRPTGTKSAVRRIVADERTEKALQLRKRGATYAAIALALGYASKSGAQEAVERAIKAITAEVAADVRELELARLDAIFRGLVRTGAFSGDTMAASTALRVMERRAKYLGLDAPTKIALDAKVEDVTHDDLLGRIARLAAAIGSRRGDREPGTGGAGAPGV